MYLKKGFIPIFFVFLFLIILNFNFISSAPNWNDYPSLNNGLVSYWTFDNASTTIAVDSINHYNLTLNNSPSAINSAKIGKGINLTSTGVRYGGSYANSSVNITQITGQNITINGWININSMGSQYGGIYKIGKNENTGDETTCVLFSEIVDIQPDTYLLNCPNTNAVTEISSAGGIGTWVMMTMEYDVNGLTLTAYANTTQIGMINLTTPITEGEFLLNNRYDGYYSDAGYDEVSIWNRTLTPTEINNLYNSGAGLQFSPASPSITPNMSISSRSPANETFNESNLIYFPIDVVTTNSTIKNVTIILDGVNNLSNTTSWNGSVFYNLSVNIPNGNHSYTIEGFDSDNTLFNSLNGTIYFSVNVTSAVEELPKSNIFAQLIIIGLIIVILFFVYDKVKGGVMGGVNSGVNQVKGGGFKI